MHVDTELLNRHKAPPAELTIEPGYFTNWLGLKTDTSYFGDHVRSEIFSSVPAGGDGVYGGYFEYASFLTAIETVPDRARFTAVELGAGWGPWISAIGVACRRLNFQEINLIGVEADKARCEFMRAHLERNGLQGGSAVNCKVVHGAAWKEDATLSFPVISPHDHGAAASAHAAERDYRGYEAKYVEVDGLSLPTICRGFPIVDYMHWDIQGAELEVARSSADFLNQHVRYLFIGTHSRFIEGGLLEFFYQNRWDMLHQQPCHFIYDKEKLTLEGMLHTDGEIFAVNPRLI